MATSFFYIYAMATSFFYIYVMATSFFYFYVMDISSFYIYVKATSFFYIYKSTERPVVLLNAIFLYETDPGNFHFSTQCNTCLWMDIVHAASRVWRPQGDCVNEREAVKKCLWMSSVHLIVICQHCTTSASKVDQGMPGLI